MSNNIADLIKNVQNHVAEQKRILAVSEVTKSTKAQDELEALIARSGEFLAAIEATEATKSGKGRKVKSRGIALVHSVQGGPANKRPESLLMKSKDGKRRVQVEISKSGVRVLTPEQEANLKGILATLKMKGAE